MLPPPPVNVRFETPEEELVNWPGEARLWRELRDRPHIRDGIQLLAHPGYYPLTVKLMYVIGVIHDISTAVTHLLSNHIMRDKFYLPAYGVFASGVDLLGRCLQGNETHYAARNRSSDIVIGFKWLKQPQFYEFESVDEEGTFISTSHGNYSISRLVSLRHFAAHGQGTVRPAHRFTDIDFEILGHMPLLLANGLECYWNAHMPPEREDISRELCNRLARADVLGFRTGPIFTSLLLFQSRQTITQMFNGFNWSYS